MYRKNLRNEQIYKMKTVVDNLMNEEYICYVVKVQDCFGSITARKAQENNTRFYLQGTGKT